MLKLCSGGGGGCAQNEIELNCGQEESDPVRRGQERDQGRELNVRQSKNCTCTHLICSILTRIWSRSLDL